MSKRADKPNVVIFFTDQQRWDCSGLHGNPLDLMPNFDRMAMEGTHLFNAFTPQPVCGPARACLQTGQYATTNGVWRNGLTLRDDAQTLATLFGDAGYRTAHIGKWHLADTNPVPPEQRGGYQYWLGSNIIEFTSSKYDCVVYDNDSKPVKLPGYRVDGLTDAAIRVIDAWQDEPFLLCLSFTEPHQHNYDGSFPAPDGYAERYAGRWLPPDLAALKGDAHQHIGGYYGMVKRLDEAFGRLLDALKSLDLDRDTIVVFASDHACHFRTRNGEYKRSCHESSMRVPCAMRGPSFDSGGRVQQQVSLVDIAPTLLDAAGLDIPDEMQGRSFLPLTRDANAQWRDEVFAQYSESGIGRVLRTPRWKYSVRVADSKGWREPTAEDYVEEHLYDLDADPYELRNLVGYKSHAEVSAELRERLLARMKEVGEPPATIKPARPRKSGQTRLETPKPDGEIQRATTSLD